MDARLGNVVRLLQTGPFDERTLRRVRAGLSALRGHRELPAEAANLIVLLDDFAESSDTPAAMANAYLAAADLCESASMSEQLVERLALALKADPTNTSTPRRLRQFLGKPGDAERLNELLGSRADTLAKIPDADPVIAADAYAQLGAARERAKDVDGAIEAYDQALEIEPNVSAVEALASLYARRRADGDAEQAADLYCMLCDVVQPEAARTQLKRALALVPGHEDAKRRLADLGGGSAPAPVATTANDVDTVVAPYPAFAAPAPTSGGRSGVNQDDENTAVAPAPLAAAAAPASAGHAGAASTPAAPATTAPARSRSPQAQSAPTAQRTSPGTLSAATRARGGEPRPSASSRSSMVPPPATSPPAPRRPAGVHSPVPTPLGGRVPTQIGTPGRVSTPVAPGPAGQPSQAEAVGPVPQAPRVASVRMTTPQSAQQPAPTPTSPGWRAPATPNTVGAQPAAAAGPPAPTSGGPVGSPLPQAVDNHPMAPHSAQPDVAGAGSWSTPAAAPGGRDEASVFQVDADDLGADAPAKSRRIRQWLLSSAGAVAAILATLGIYTSFSDDEAPQDVASAATTDKLQGETPAATRVLAAEENDPKVTAAAPQAMQATPEPKAPAGSEANEADKADEQAKKAADDSPTEDAPPDAEEVAEQQAEAAKPDPGAGRAKKGNVIVRVIRNRTRIRGGGLTKKQFYAAVGGTAPKLQQCYREVLRRNPKLQGRLVYRFGIRTTGRVKGFKRVAGNIELKRLISCTSRALKRTRFPRLRKGKTAQVRTAFRFRAK